jgi:hypothetical protein
LALVTEFNNRNSTLTKDARLVNCYAEKDPLDGEYWVEKRVGLSAASTFSGTGYGVYNWQGVIYAIFGNTLYAGSTVVGTVDTSNGPYKFVEIRGNPGYLVLGNGVQTYYTQGGASLTTMTGNTYVTAGQFVIGSKYTIISTGTTSFTSIGAAANTPGTVFTATGIGSGTGTAALTATSFVANSVYAINTVGTTDFTLIGAASNTVGTVFTCTGPGTGTGTVQSHTFPSNLVKGFAYLDGTLYVMDNQANIWGTLSPPYGSFDNPTVWDPLNVIVARVEPDRGVALAKQLVYVIAFKQWTTEVFYDAGNATGSPLSPVAGAKSAYGCISADSIQSIDDMLFFVTSNRTVSPQVAVMFDLRVTIVSNPAVDRLLDTANFTSIYSWNFKHAGHRFYGLTIKSSNLTLVYDLDQKLWYQWTDVNGNYWPIVDQTYTTTSGQYQHLMQGETSGILYNADGDYIYPTDNGDVIPVDIYTGNNDFGVDRRKMLTVMRMRGDVISGCTVGIRVSDDDYQTWSNFREVDMGKRRPILTNCGTFHRRAWNIRHRKATAFRIKSAELQMDVGTL